MAIRRKPNKTVARAKAKPASALGRALRERDEAQRFQAATGEILASLSRSLGDAKPVFEAIVENVLRVFGTRYAAVFIVEGDRLHLRAAKGDAEFEKRKAAVFARFRASFPQRIDYEGFTGKALRSGKVSQLAPVIGNPQATPQAVELAKTFGYDAMLVAPLMREGKAIGAIGTTRPEGKPFDDRALALFEAFAAQAVIAIENARLFNGLKTTNATLQESLEQQTATAEILRAISTSPADVKPVFETIIRNAVRLGGAYFGCCFRYDGNMVDIGADYNFSPEAQAAFRRAYPQPASRENPASHSIFDRTVINVADVLHADYSPAAKERARVTGYRSLLSVPMMRNGEVLGSITMARKEVGAFPDSYVALVKTFADQAVIAIENSRLFNETKEALERQTATGEILSVIAGSPTDVQPVFDSIIVKAVRLCGGLFGAVYRYEEGLIHLKAWHNFSAEALEAMRRRYPQPPGDESLVARCIRSASIIDVPDIDADESVPPGSRSTAQALGYRSQLTVPLLRDGSPIGAIVVAHKDPGRFPLQQVQLLQTFADQAVIAIENARLFNETKEALERQTATADVLKVISGSPTDVAPVFDAILKSAVTLCDAELAAVFAYDGNLVHMVATHNWPEEALRYFSKIYPSPPSPKLLSGRTILTKAVVEITDSAADPDYDPTSVVTGHWRRMLGAPMLREGRPLGVLVVAWREPGETPQRQVDLLQTFADQAAIAIENVRLFNETKEALDRQTATADILRVISSSQTDLQPVFDTIIRNCVRLGDASFGSLFHLDAEGRIEIGAHHNFDARAEALFRARFPHPLSPDVPYGKAMIEGAAVNVPDFDASAFSQASKERARALGTRAVLAVPLMRQGRAIGAIAIGRREPGAFADAYVSLIGTFADQAVIAIENVRLLNETKEALEQQRASSEILQVIAQSPTDVRPVFEALTARAAHLCEAEQATLVVAEDNLLRPVVSYSVDAGPLPQPSTMIRPSRDYITGRAVVDCDVVNVEDAVAVLDTEFPGARENQRALGFRSMLVVPLMRDKRAIGAIGVWRRVVRRFSGKHVALLKTFADQAVIAIENVRLFNETKEALDQQKASADVLGAISSSIADTQPVFEKILDSCRRLFGGHDTGIGLVGEDGRVHLAAHRGPNADELRKVFPVPLSRESGTGSAILERRVKHYPDVFGGPEVPDYVLRSAEKVDFKSVVFAPMFWDGRGMGAIWVGRNFAGAFTEKQIALLQTFADQAVIAIQNARLFREIQEKSAQLEVANKHKSDFLASMSHELRTPLNAIIGFSEVLSERMFGELNEKQAEYLKDIHESGRHLLSLINDILDLSKIEAGRMELELSRFHLPSAVSNAMTLVRERAQRHGIQLAVAIDPGLGELQADERKVKQILLNLLSNAVKFTPDGGRVDVSARKADGKVEIAVKDTGIGIAPEDHAAVFEEFKQVGRDYTRKAEGTGLGLALTRRLVELHGGDIALESAPGKGSTFTVRLPLR